MERGKGKEELEEWDNFQMESDRVRQLILSYSSIKCELSGSGISASHRSECEKYHEEENRRRKPFRDGKLTYVSEICDFVLKNETCVNGEICIKSHNIIEVMYHPSKYRTVMCENNCKGNLSKFCPFAHSVDQLRNGSSYMSRLKNEVIEISEFDLNQFKTVKCFISTKHNEKQCLGFHSSKDKRRNPQLVNYSPEMCPRAEKENTCINGELCNKSHNKVELFYHPDKFKTKFCSHFNLENPKLIENCLYGKYCSFAHSEEEIKIELIHRLNRNEDFFTNYFKTISCPFTYHHEKAACVYSHNWQDCRRSPLKIVYRNSSCPKWDNKKTILNYKDGCPDEMFCILCHGWKEEDFHPLNYKTKKCKNYSNNCNKKEFCPFYHQYEEKRKISQNVKEDFKLRLKSKENEKKNFNMQMVNNNNNAVNNLNTNFNLRRNNKSEIILMNNKNLYMNFNSNYNSNYNTNTNTHSNNSNNNFIHHHNSFTYTGNLMNFNYSPNHSYNSFNFSDNLNNSKRKSFDSQISNNSFKSNFSYNQFSLSDNKEEYFGGGLLNPDDSLEFKQISHKFDFNINNFNSTTKEENKDKNLENIEQSNYLLKQLLKDSDWILNNQKNKKTETNYEEFMDYLLINNFKTLYEKIKTKKIEIKNLIEFDDQKILSFIEEEQRHLYDELRQLLMKLEVNIDGEDLLKSLNMDLNINDEFNMNNC